MAGSASRQLVRNAAQLAHQITVRVVDRLKTPRIGRGVFLSTKLWINTLYHSE